ncbi:helix-turn-helix transcriptional regulator [Lysinibacillus sp. M3]|uniref:Helix-turn-helix transcriptional regulator n=1 Tax=Lysinibacillus zambalensis TaxID=3160866 RepID=A0ABV1MRS2_9BACI
MFQQRLKIARKNKKYTQEELAELVVTTKATISNYENGYSSPSIEMLLLLSAKLDVSVDYLLGNEEREFDLIDSNFTKNELEIIKDSLNNRKNEIDSILLKIERLLK